MTRKEFLASAAGGLVAGAMGGAAPATELRVGIMSDTHVTGLGNAQWFEKGLRMFDAEKVDAVLISGDMFTLGSVKELEDIASVWYKVFPNDRRADGGKVERLFVTGNHDEVDWDCKRFGTPEGVKAKAFRFNREATWKRLWGEDYEKIRIKTVKGYKFVLRHWLCRSARIFDEVVPAEADPLPDFMKAHADELRSCGRPFFYVQHEPIADTVNAAWLFGGIEWDNGHTKRGEKRIFDQFPNAVVLTGHSHDTLTDEQSIWQGAFTAVNCSCARGYVFTKPGRENGFTCEDFARTPPLEMAMFDHSEPRQALVMDVCAGEIRFKRLDVTYGEVLDADWVVPLFPGGATVPPTGTPKYDFKARAAASKPPVFAKDAKVTVTYVKDGHSRAPGPRCILEDGAPHPQVRVSFPPITRAHSPSRGFDFTVRCEANTGDLFYTVREKRVFSPKFCLAEKRDTETCTCDFRMSDIPANFHGRVRFVVIPHDVWGNPGAPICSAWINPDALAKQ